MWLELIEAGILIGTFVYHRWIEDHPSPLAFPKVPSTNEGTPVSLVYGQCRVKSPILAWAGDWQFFSPEDFSPRWVLDSLYIIGAPFYGGNATLLEVFAGDVLLSIFPIGTLPGFTGADPYNLPATAGISRFQTNNAITALGGPGHGGGISGTMEFFDGRPTQVVTDFIGANGAPLTNTEAVLTGEMMRFALGGALHAHNSVLITTIPSYRNLMLCCLYLWNIGESPNISSYSFHVTSLSTGTPSDFGQSLVHDADPAAVIYDLLTSPWGKVNLSPDRINIASFAAASLTLFNEEHGYSRVIDQAEDVSAIIADILKQIDGMLYEEPTTGQLILKLIRNDYSISTLVDINPDNASPDGSAWYKVSGWSETPNQIRVTFTDRDANYADGVAFGQNGANIFGQKNKVRPMDLKFVGCCTRGLAARIAGRELMVASQPVTQASVVVNRSFYALRPGDVVTFTWPELGISKMVMRVARVSLGQLHDGRIKLDMLRDIFDQSLGAYPSPPTLPPP